MRHINIYLRANDTFIPIGSYIEGTPIFNILNNYAPDLKLAALISQDFITFTNDAIERIEADKVSEEEERKTISTIMNSNNAIREKLKLIDEIEANIKNYENEINQLEYAKCIFSQFFGMINLLEESGLYFDNDADHYIYFGVDAIGSMENVLVGDK